MTEFSIVLLGAGTIGASWAALFLSHNAKVTVFDPSTKALSELRPYIKNAWRDLKKLDPTLNTIPWQLLKLSQDLAMICDKPDWVQENAPDRLKLKQNLLQEAETYLPNYVPIASSTTALLATDIQAEMIFPERFLIAHPFNPPHLIPLVEVVAGEKTASGLTERAKNFYEGFGKEVIIPKREAIGHVANRLNAALYREVVNMVATGIASVEDIDRAVVHSLGLRWAFLGPNLVYHLGGGEGGYAQYLEHLGSSQEARWKDLGEVALTPEIKQNLVDGLKETLEGQTIETLCKERDNALVKLLSLKNAFRQEK